MVTKTPNLELTEVQQADVGNSAGSFNDSFWALDAIVQLSVLSRSVTVAPTSNAEGDRYIVPVAGVASSDPWFGHSRQIAYWSAGGWLFKTPRPGWQAFVEDESSGSPADAVTVTYLGTRWDIGAGAPPSSILLDVGDILIMGPSGPTRFAVGADNQVLLSLAAQTDRLKWQTLLANKGGILGYTGAALGELAPGSNGDVLTLDNGQTLGFKWASGGGGGGGGGGGNLTPDTHPSSATAYDDEFESSSLSAIWTWQQQNTATDAFASGSIILTAQQAAGSTVNVLDQALPGTSCSFVCKAGCFIPSSGGFSGPITLRESLTGKLFTFGIFNSSGSMLLVSAVGTLLGGFVSNPFGNVAAPPWFSFANQFPSAQSYWRADLDLTGSTLKLFVSQDGVVWNQYAGTTFPLLTYFTLAPDRIGYGFQASGTANSPPQLSSDWFRRVA